MDHRSGGDLDEETVAWKRSRRVSFADTTAVHVFDRDEDFDTPPTDSKPSPDSLGFRGDHSDTDDSKGSRDDGDEADDGDVDEEEEEEEEEELRFVRDMDSSPGSAVGSVTSNDDDNFFGPVSTSFIKSGRLSDSGMSDDNNHDITLDSTAFSLHFQNIARPEDCSANSRSLRSPTEYSVPTDSPGFVVPKGFIQQVPLSRLSDGKMSDTAGNSTNMSIIVENLDRYDDYGKMSPTLEALLTEANKRIHHDSPIDAIGSLTSKVCDDEVAVGKESGKDDTTTSSMRVTDNAADDAYIDTPVSGRCSTGIEVKLICDGIPSPNKAETPPIDASSNKKTQGTLSSKVSDSFRDVCGAIQSNLVAVDAQNSDLFRSIDSNVHNDLTLQSGQVNVELSPDKVRRGGKHDSNSSPELRPSLVPMNGQEQSLLSELGMHTPKDAVQPLPIPLHGSISSLRAKRQQLFYDPSVLSQTRLIYTPDNEQPPSSLKIELTRFGERISAIKSRISKSKILTSPNTIDSRPALHDKDRLPTELNVRVTVGKTNNDLNRKHIVASDTYTEDALNVDQEDSLHNISLQGNHLEFQIAQTVSATSLETNEVIGDTVEMTTGVSPILVTQSDINKQSQLTPYGPIKQVSTLDVHDLSLVGALQHKESSQVSNNLRNAISSPVDVPRFKLSKSQGAFLSPKANGTTSSSTFFEENDIPVNNCTYISSNNSREQKDNSRNCNSRSQVELTSSVSLKERMSVRNSCSPNKSAVDVAYKETSAINKSMNKSMKLCSVGSLQSPNNNTNSNISMVQSSNLVEMVQTKPSNGPMLFGHDFSYHGQQYVRELHSVEDEKTGKKRSIEQIFLTNKDHIGEKSRSQKSPKVSSNVMGGNSGIFVIGHLQCSNESESIGGEEPQRHWMDMISSVSNNMKELFSPAIFKLSLQELDILEDALSALHSGRKYARLSASLRNHDFSSIQKREAEASSLLDKLAYEKAKVQLKRMRLDQLSSKVHLRKARLQECGKLKAICSRLCFLGARTVQESQIHSVSSNHTRRNQDEDVRVTSMRQELEVVGEKVKLLVKSFESYCNIKGNMNCDGIINAVNDHLEATNCCRVIQQDLQLWKMSDVMKKNDCCSIILNYRDLLTKSYTINNSASNMVANNLLMDASIEKNFPNMNACTPFQFVLNDKDVGKVASLKHLQQDTMETNLLFGVLLDVLEEILVSRMQLWNLISSTFHSRCSGQLELQLCFLSFKSGRKVSLSLDLSGLNCGVYPSEPSDLRFQLSNELPSSISDEIQRTVRNLPNGRPMIFRLCQSISQVVKVSI